MKERLFSSRNTEVKKVRALLEETPLFGEEEREAGEIDLLVVSLDLSEICVQSDIEDEVGGEVVFEVKAGIALP